MELKPYQQQVIADLELFLETLQKTRHVEKAYFDFWSNHPRTALHPFPGTAIEPYKNNVEAVPHVCIKVPTAGGKTFIACNAIHTIFSAYALQLPRAVVWLVPSVTILEQTFRNLSDQQHPYRQKINVHFNNKVEVFDKQALLQGSGFNGSSVHEQLNIFVLSFDSLRAKNKEERKVFQENGNLLSFQSMLGETEEISLMKVIQNLRPVVIVDESHNAETDLSVEMLRNLNPSFILDLTATPRKNSNIVSFIDALELKKENMVKLPVIVYNHVEKTDVIASALQLRKKLEMAAIAEQEKGAPYIRPIVLFQAQSNTGTDNTTFQKLKDKLIELKIPGEQIKIKTANINEIKDIDLMSPECPVRFIITINALKEGWDCPFAYVLASLADKSSAVDVEQILGRILRQPYVKKHDDAVLNMSYVLTASGKFLDTLDNIVKGLNKAGFSANDYKVAEGSLSAVEKDNSGLKQNTVEPQPVEFDDTFSMSAEELYAPELEQRTDTIVQSIFESGKLQDELLAEKIVASTQTTQAIIPNDIQNLVKSYPINAPYIELAAAIELPMFFFKKPGSDIFTDDEVLLNRGELLEGFQLGLADANISFDSVSAELYKVDLDETKTGYTPGFIKLDGNSRDKLLTYILSPANRTARLKNLVAFITSQLGKMDPISEAEIKAYVTKIAERFDDTQIRDFSDNQYSYCEKIKERIKQLSDEYAEKRFDELLVSEKILLRGIYKFPERNNPQKSGKAFSKSLYETEDMLNGFEEELINEIAALPNVVFWTRNIERRQFLMNGFVNHYPDFIVYTASGKIVVVEAKGDDRDNSNSAKKIKLGKAWEDYDKKKFRYMMVFNQQEFTGAFTKAAFLKILREL